MPGSDDYHWTIDGFPFLIHTSSSAGGIYAVVSTHAKQAEQWRWFTPSFIFFLFVSQAHIHQEVGGGGENCTWTCTRYPTLGFEEMGLD